jgi:uncharacterized protein (DUF697 family)/tellurite resistance protein
MLDDQQNRAMLEIALMAAFADGLNDDRERAHLKQVADAIDAEANFDFPALYREVLLGKRDPATPAAALTTPEARQLAYEMAVGVCDADGTRNEKETAFLASLAQALGMPVEDANDLAAKADDIVAAAETPPAAGASVTTGGAVQPAPSAAGAASAATAELDRTILNHAITAAALELLPDSLANLAVIPVQLKLVHRVGQTYGYPMDTSNAKDFLAVLGVGLASQYFEGFARKLLGGVLGGLGGKLGRAAGRQAASSGLAFATTYAIGKVANEYYAAGRTIEPDRLKASFNRLVGDAQALVDKYSNEIQARAKTIDTKQLTALVRGT